MPELAEAYRERLLAHQNVVRAEVTSAAPLSPEKTKALEESLSKVTGKKVELSVSIDPELLGGVVARIGSTVYDGSVQDAAHAHASGTGQTMSIKADEISKIIREQIGSFACRVDVAEVGTVVSLGDGIARVHGCQRAMAGEMLEFPHGVFGIALNLEEDSVGAVLLGEFIEIKEGDPVKRTGRIISVPVGEAMLGRVVNALGQPIDGKGPILTKEIVADRAHRARRRRPPAGPRAAADRPQVD